MDEITQILKGILEKDITSLTETDISFLNARRSYLNTEQIERFKGVLKKNVAVGEVATPVQPTSPTVEEQIDRAEVMAEPPLPSPTVGEDPANDHSADPDWNNK